MGHFQGVRSMSAQHINELTAPPVVGKFYRVPTLYCKHHTLVSHWPLIGPKHNDAQFFKTFEWDHFHVDYRFLSASQRRTSTSRKRTVAENSAASPIINQPIEGARSYMMHTTNTPQVRLKKCSASDTPYPYREMEPVKEIQKHFREGERGVRCVRTRDGRALCPHQKADLTSFPVQADGTVICPLHGLKVRVIDEVSP